MLTTHNENEISNIRKQASLIYLFEKRSFDIFCGLAGLVLVAAVSLVLLPFYSYGRNKGPFFSNKRALDDTGIDSKFISFEVWLSMLKGYCIGILRFIRSM